MTDFHDTHPFSLGGGLNLADAPELIRDSQALELENVRFTGEGRWTFPRRALRELFDGLADPCAFHAFPHGSFVPTGETEEIANGGIILDWTGTQVNLYVTDGSRFREFIGPLAGWTSVGMKPKTIAAVIGNAIWICDEARQYGLTCYDPLRIYEEHGAATALFQPKFKFEQNTDSDPAPIFPRTIERYNNMLWVAGYGDEDDRDRPEILRHSYIGFTPDAQTVAGGDAAMVVNPAYMIDAEGTVLTPDEPEFLRVAGGVEGLFAVDDGFPVGTRGIPIVGLYPGAERMVIATRFPAFTLYGWDRDSFQLEQVDAERGCAASRAGGEADGIAYWFSNLGPCRWAGGKVQPLEREIQKLIEAIDQESVWFLHQPIEYEVRWFYGDGTRSLDYNYRYNKWKTSVYAIPLYAGGTVQPGTILAPATPGDPTLFPLVAPAGVQHEDIQQRQAMMTWANGETGPDIKSEVEIKKTADAVWMPAGTVDSGVDRFLHVNLEIGTAYDDRVRHTNPSTGQFSGWAPGAFTTLGIGILPAPRNLRVALTFFADADERCEQVAEFFQLNWENGGLHLMTDIRARRVDTGEERMERAGRGYAWASFEYKRNSTCIEQNFIDPFYWDDPNVTVFPIMWSIRHVSDSGAQSPWTDEVGA